MDKNISLIGIGKLGICFALNLEKKGYNVIGVDISSDYVNLVNNKSLNSEEDHVNDLLKTSTNFIATTDISKSVENDSIFILVATPSLPNGEYDHSQIERTAEELINLGVQKNTKHLVICCTTMPGYCDQLAEKMSPYNYTVSYNPEFIAQGTIIKDQLYPDMVLIGEANAEAGDMIQKVYSDMVENSPRYCRMNRKEAEITKIALNCFLTTKITFANMVGDVAEASNCDPYKILSAIGSDSRVGNKYLGWGFGFGGPCFPRDNRAFAIHSKSVNIHPSISIATDDYNKLHLDYYSKFLAKNITDHGISFSHVTYKPESTILEESQQLRTAEILSEKGFKVIVHEKPSVISKLQTLYSDKFEYIERS
jgi:UDPglucose 6-dehydrogenase